MSSAAPLALTSSQTQAFRRALPALKELKFSKESFFLEAEDSIFEAIANLMPEEWEGSQIDLANCSLLTEKGLTALFQKALKIETLNLAACSSLKSLSTLDKRSSLKTVDLSGVELSAEEIIAFVKKQFSIETLYLNGIGEKRKEITLEQAEGILRSAPSLKMMQLNNTTLIDAEIISLRESFPAVTILN